MKTFKRITKREAFKRFCLELPFLVFPCKMSPSNPWNMAFNCLSNEYLERAFHYRDNAKIWAGTIQKTAWNLMYNNWSYYNASYETGYYAHYYVEE